MAMSSPSNAPILFTMKFPSQNPRPTSPQPPATTSKILPLICPKVVPRNRYMSTTANDKSIVTSLQPPAFESRVSRPQKFPAAGAAPYVPIRQLRTPCHGMAPPVTIRTAVPVFSAPPCPAPSAGSPQPPAQSVAPPHRPPSLLRTHVTRAPFVRIASSVTIRQAVPVFAAPPVQKEDKQSVSVKNEDIRTVSPASVFAALPVRKEDKQSVSVKNEDITIVTASAPPNKSHVPAEEAVSTTSKSLQESETVQSLEQLKI